MANDKWDDPDLGYIEDEKERERVEQLHANLLDLLNADEAARELADPFTLLRFLRARQGSLVDAEAMFRETMVRRREINIAGLMDEWSRKPSTPRVAFTNAHFYGSRIVNIACEDGSPILVERIGIADLAGINREGCVDLILKACIYYFEDAFQAVRKESKRLHHLVRVVVIVDAQGMGLATLSNISVVKRVASIGKANYPEVTKGVAIVRGPWVFEKCWSLVLALLPPATRKKVTILGADFAGVLQTQFGVDTSTLPAFLGGKGDDSLVLPALPLEPGAGAALIATELPPGGRPEGS